MDLKQQIINDINENPIILYMKGQKICLCVVFQIQ